MIKHKKTIAIGLLIASSFIYNNCNNRLSNKKLRDELSVLWNERQQVKTVYNQYIQGIIHLCPAAAKSLEEKATKHFVGGDWWYKVDTSGLWWNKFYHRQVPNQK